MKNCYLSKLQYRGNSRRVNKGLKMVRQDSIIAGTGFILLTLWAVIFVNILLSNPGKRNSDWHKRLEPMAYSSSSEYSNSDRLLVLATTLMAPEVYIC